MRAAGGTREEAMEEMAGIAVGAKNCCLYGRHGHKEEFGEASGHTILETKLKAPACGAHGRKLKEIISKKSRKQQHERNVFRIFRSKMNFIYQII
jgi:hypothetical protein